MYKSNLDLLMENSNKLDDVSGTFGKTIFKKCNALNLTLRNSYANVDDINRCRQLIKNSSSIISNFRGNNLLTLAVNLSLEENPSDGLDAIMDVYSKLKKKFFPSQFLVLAALVIYNSRDRIDVDLAVDKTRVAYDYMKGNHFFITGQDDLSAAALIATSSSDLDFTFKEIEKCYEYLKVNDFWPGNNLQSLSHILSLFEGDFKEKCDRVIRLNRILREHNVPLKRYALPLLGVCAFVTDDYDLLAKYIKEVDSYLKNQPGFSSFSLGYTARSMVVASLVSFSLAENCDESLKSKLIETNNNVALNIVYAIQVATTSAGASAAAAASASNN